MKRKQKPLEIQVFIAEAEHQCDFCHHSRKGEPFVQIEYYRSNGNNRFEIRCWRCCRDAESTFMIAQKWPMAFDRLNLEGSYYLAWSPGVKELVGEHGKA